MINGGKSILIEDILASISHLKYIGNRSIKITGITNANPLNIEDNVLMWVSDKNIDKLTTIKHGVIICSDRFKDYKESCHYIVVANPRLAFKSLLEIFFSVPVKEGIEESARVHPTVQLGEGIYIGHNVVIEEGCIIGNQSIILHNTVVFKHTHIGNNVKIGANNTIGGVGFGYEKDETNQYSLIPHIGNVVVFDNVDIGNNNCIDRAVLGSTEIHENAKIDNFVHIAHGVVIGENSLIIANAMIGGSVIIGKNVWVAPSSSIINKVTIGSNATIGMGAVVIKNVNDGETVVGNPAKVLNK